MSEKKPVKITKLVVEAIRHLKAERAFTPKEIINYIEANHGASDKMVKCVFTALKRGTDYGIFRTDGGRFALKETATLPHLLARRNVTEEDPDEKSCRPKRRRSRRPKRSCGRKVRRRSKRKCGCKKSRSRRRRRSRRSGCKRRSSRRRRRSRKSKRGRCGKKRRSRRRRRRRGGKKCGGRRHRRARRSRSRCGRSRRRRRAKCRC